MQRLLVFLITLAISTLQVSAGEKAPNWPQWRGPNADGSSATADPPVEWSSEKNVKWKVEVPGKGSSTPIIWDDKIIILTTIETDRRQEGAAAPAAKPAEQESAGRPQRQSRNRSRGGRGGFGGPAPTNFHEFIVACYSRSTGDQLWQTTATEAVPHEAGHGDNNFASSSPVTDGKYIYVSFGSRGVYCFDMQGKQVWKTELGTMQTRARFGEGSSPALFGNTLIVPWDHEGQSYMIALNANTGDINWKVERDEVTTWATPFIVEHNGRTQVVANGNRVRSYDLDTGDLIWECGGQVQNPIPSPVLHDDVVVCMTGYRGNAIYAVPLDASGDVTDSDKIAWNRKDAAPYVSSPTLYKGQLYFTKSREGIMSSVDVKTGKDVIGQSRLPGISKVYASPVAAADRIYFTGRDGTTVVLKHGTSLDVLATNTLGEAVDASPAIVGSEMFIRGEIHLFCIAQ